MTQQYRYKLNVTQSLLLFSYWLLVLQSHYYVSIAFTPSLIVTQYQYQQSQYNTRKDYNPLPKQNNNNNNNNRFISINTLTSLNLSSTSLPDTSTMKASELRKELDSYGISTKSFFEKIELIEAVEKARMEGKTPIGNTKVDDDGGSSDDNDVKTESTSRNEKLAQEMEKCNKMKVGELKKELESYGVSTKSFFEKSEFVRAVAEARVDGVKDKKRTSRTSTSRGEEEYDPSYRDVKMQKMDMRTLMGSPAIDVRLG